MASFKFTGKNGGDPKEYWRSIRLSMSVQISDALKGGRFLINKKILPLTEKGLDFEGNEFEPYTDEYARRKGQDTVDLRVSGKMLGALRMSVNGRIYGKSERGTSKEPALSMGVGIYDSPKQAKKGAIHNEGFLVRVATRGKRQSALRGAVRRMPKRRWLDATSDTVQKMNETMGESMAARIQETI